MTKSSVSQDDSLLLPPESREPCRKPAAVAGEVSVFCSWCCISPRDCGPERSWLRPGLGLAGEVRALPARGTLTGGEARCEVELLLELLPEPELGYEGTGTGGAAGQDGSGQLPTQRGQASLHPQTCCTRWWSPRPPQPAGGRGAGTPTSHRTHTSSRRCWCPEKGDGRTRLQEAGWGERGLRRAPSQGFQGQGLPPPPPG